MANDMCHPSAQTSTGSNDSGNACNLVDGLDKGMSESGYDEEASSELRSLGEGSAFKKAIA